MPVALLIIALILFVPGVLFGSLKFLLFVCLAFAIAAAVIAPRP